MVSMLEWAKSIDKSKRNRPNQNLQVELLEKLSTGLQDESISTKDCVETLAAFKADMVELFYIKCYWTLSKENQDRWTKAFLTWASSKNPTDSATLRVIIVLRLKLIHYPTLEESMPELLWLSIHEDKKTISAIKMMRENCNVLALRKLLTLDMTDWKCGQVQIFKIYAVLFENTLDSEVKKMYEDFLSRHGTNKAKAQGSSTSLCIETHIVSQSSEELPEGTHTPAQASEANSIPTEPAFAEAKVQEGSGKSFSAEMASQPISCTSVETKISSDGVLLAEALMQWAREQKLKTLEQNTKIADISLEVQQQQAKIAALNIQIAELSATVAELQHTKAGLESEVVDSKAQIDRLRTEKERAESTIGQVQQMSGNSVKQELDGFKAKLANSLTSTVKDFRTEWSEEEKADIYAALLEDMIGILNANGIAVEGE